MHEASLYDKNIFITLSYNDENLPEDRSLKKEHFQKFMKRLRKRYAGNSNATRIRFFHCGEYGEKYLRPHYHALIFNFDFSDKYYWKNSKCGTYPIYRSEELEELWPFGFSEIGSVTPQSAAYVARYQLKKAGPKNEDQWLRLNMETGEYVEVTPEYVTMSRRPGIGKEWIDKWKSDVYPADICVVDGKEWKPPRFYDNQLEEKELEEIKGKRARYGKKDSVLFDQTVARRLVREKVKKSKIKHLPRDFE
jgi:hypothetical protein